MADDGKWELSREEINERVRKQNAEKDAKGPTRADMWASPPYSTALKIRDIQVRQICWEPREQVYTPEF